MYFFPLLWAKFSYQGVSSWEIPMRRWRKASGKLLSTKFPTSGGPPRKWRGYYPPGQWLNFYGTGKDEPAFVFQSGNSFAPPCWQWHNITLPPPVQCFTVGIHSRYLREWKNIFGKINGIFYDVKIICTNRGPKMEGKKMKLYFSMAKWLPLVGT